jgi:hypothetical protein
VFICIANSNQFGVTIFGTNRHTLLDLKYVFFKPRLSICASYEIQHPLTWFTKELWMFSGDHQFSPKNHFLPLFFHSCFQTLLSSCLEGYVLLSTDQEMSHAQNMTGAHVQVFMVDMTICYFPSRKHSCSALANYTLLEKLDVFCLRAAVCRFYQ